MNLLVVSIAIYSVTGLLSGLWLWGYLRQRRVEAQLRASIQNLERRIEEPPAVPASLQEGINWTLRTQILRLSRRGDRPETIAALTGASPGEVAFALKIAQLPAQLFELGP